ncbi:MAG: hypothetical protein J6B98_01430 [Bacilli bacterium]|nr:hypothetical protein [Bacilli bacterium]
MKEAIGTSYVFSLVITFVGILIAMFVGSIAYTKGFKVRNKIIDIIDKNEGYTLTVNGARDQIDESLASIGYRIVDKECPTKKGVDSIAQSDYRYCVYEYTNEQKGTYYGVTVFIHFDIPLIGNFIEIPIYGESRLIFDKDKIKEA